MNRGKLYKPTIKSYFSGAGGLDLGFARQGYRFVQSLEYDPHCIKTLAANFSHPIVDADIRNITVLSQDPSDVITATYPCTKYSTAADIHGKRTGDDLFLHFFRHMAIEQPEAYMVENVPGMRCFPVVMEAMTKLPGYYVNIFCPVDSNNWLPQNRKRLILFGTKKPFTFREPSPNTKAVRLSDIIQSDVHIDIPKSVVSRLNGKYRDLPIISDPANNDLAPTCVAHYSKDVSTRLIVDRSYPRGVRPYTVREYARLQGFPDSFQFKCSDREAYRQIGNAVSIPVGEWGASELLRYFNRKAA